ncbi:hypothetical protein GH714_005339 [Hevea brasiliensis]|uniref:Uncharacterized protein n=1 Tax=Hevea brasiliensis TaxID=3981 RepID=A0A6A6KMQ9_HEVBR|nr:hypothetical protein GH714_005339 [Hevea brasiliensis]
MTMAANSATGSTGATTRVCCPMHNEANNCNFFLWYDNELVLGSRERCVFDVIFDKIERLQAIILSKTQNKVELERNFMAAEANLVKKKDKVRRLKEDRSLLHSRLQKMHNEKWRMRLLCCVNACDVFYCYQCHEGES